MTPPLVLIVDDEWLNRELMEGILLLQDYRVIQAHSGEQALRLAIEQHPDLVLLDVRMPRMDGFEVSRRLKSDPATDQIPIIMLSGLEANEEERLRALDAGADDLINRSILNQELADRVAELLALRRNSAD